MFGRSVEYIILQLVQDLLLGMIIKHFRTSKLSVHTEQINSDSGLYTAYSLYTHYIKGLSS